MYLCGLDICAPEPESDACGVDPGTSEAHRACVPLMWLSVVLILAQVPIFELRQVPLALEIK